MARRYEIEHAVQEALLAVITVNSAPVTRRLYTVVSTTVNATVLDLNGNVLTLFSGETGSSTISNPTTANATTGAIEAWVEAPDFDIVVSGTSVTSYTQKVRLSQQNVFNVKSYGAKSDNATNDLTNVQTAYNAAANAGVGNTVYFPNTGTYIISGSLTTPNTNPVYLAGGGLTSIPTVAKPSVASAGTTNLPPNAGLVTVTGTTTITNIGIWPAGTRITLVFTGALTLTDGGNLVLNGNFVTTANDTITIISDGSNWVETGRSAN